MSEVAPKVSPKVSPIGMLDSGVGGLSVLREVRALLPGRDLIYIGDSAWCPYGTKSPEQIRQRVFELTDLLVERGAELIVIACNSATIAAVESLRAAYPIEFVGMEPGVKPAAAATKSGVVGVLATEASIAGEKFHRLVDNHAGGVRVITEPCPKFVELVEAGCLAGSEVEEAIAEYTQALTDAGADVIVLGCTHYPFLKSAIEKVVGDEVEIVDTGKAVARRVLELAGGSESEECSGTLEVLMTGSRSGGWDAFLQGLVPELDLPPVELLDVEGPVA